MSKTEELSALLYTTYCEAVGGIAFNGDPLPTWEEFANDPEKEKQANAWRETAKAATLIEAARTAPLWSALAALVGASKKEELEGMEAVLRAAPIPAADKVAMIDGINVLLAML